MDRNNLNESQNVIGRAIDDVLDRIDTLAFAGDFAQLNAWVDSLDPATLPRAAGLAVLVTIKELRLKHHCPAIVDYTRRFVETLSPADAARLSRTIQNLP